MKKTDADCVTSGVVEEGRPVRSHKKPRRHDEEAELGYFEKSPRGRNRNADYIYSPPGRARTNAARQVGQSTDLIYTQN